MKDLASNIRYSATERQHLILSSDLHIQVKQYMITYIYKQGKEISGLNILKIYTNIINIIYKIDKNFVLITFSQEKLFESIIPM